MARTDATGSAYESRGKFYLVVSTGKGKRQSECVPSATCKADALARARVASELVAALRERGQVQYVATTIEQVAIATEAELGEIREVVGRIIGGNWPASSKAARPASGTTFAEVAEMLTSGDLEKKYPDAVEAVTADYARDRATKLRKYILPVIGPLPVASLTIEHGHDVMGRCPVTLSKSTRKQVLQQMKFVAGLAVSPLRLIKANPFPSEFKVKAGKDPRKRGFLYPDEDAAMLAERENPIAYRMAFGFQTREGMRREEMAALEWSALDLKHGVVRLDVNKTDDPRDWPLDPGVVEALKRWKRMAPAGPFVFGGAAPLPLDPLADELRACLLRAGVDRPELHEGTEQRMRAGTHDLRATFVTIASAQGRNERYITKRTGHRSHSMVATYQRAAEGLGEGDAVRLVPLCDAIPELALYALADTSAALAVGGAPANGGAGSSIAAISSDESSVELTRIERAASRVRF